MDGERAALERWHYDVVVRGNLGVDVSAELRAAGDAWERYYTVKQPVVLHDLEKGRPVFEG